MNERQLTPEEIAELENKLVETRDKLKPMVDAVIKEAYVRGIPYNCIWCSQVIHPDDFSSLQEFNDVVQSHSDHHAYEKTGVNPSR